MSRTTRAIERDVAHRPWPLPERRWVMFQSWQKLLFMHWPVPFGMLRPLVPAPLELERYDGSAWVGIASFLLTGLRPRGVPVPAIPALSEFPELNLRTYVRSGGRSGVYFFSLDAASTLAVIGARSTYRLPYFTADMSLREREQWIEFRSRRRRRTGVVSEAHGQRPRRHSLHGEKAEVVVRYRPSGPAFHATPGSFDAFVAERYALFAVVAGESRRSDIHHAQWPLQPVDVELTRNTLARAHGITLPDTQPIAHYAAKQDTLIWWPTTVR
jgi:uncharacterized protein